MSGNPERLRRAFRPPPEHYDVRGTAAFAVSQAYRALRQILAADRQELGLYEGRDLVLLEIARLGGQATPKRVAASLGVTPASLSTVLRRSVAAGYATRERDPADRRRWRLGLTPTGLASIRLAASMWRDADDALRARLTSSDVVWLRHLSQEARLAWRRGPGGASVPGGLSAPGAAPGPGWTAGLAGASREGSWALGFRARGGSGPRESGERRGHGTGHIEVHIRDEGSPEGGASEAGGAEGDLAVVLSRGEDRGGGPERVG
jgi:MarR family transcriptional regulator, lower aerobic nicotinate degradation pathway regulator